MVLTLKGGTPMRIESLGLPGSGKSTLVRALHARVSTQKIRSHTSATLHLLDKKTPKRGLKALWSSARKRQSYRIAEYISAYPEAVALFHHYYPDRPRNMALHYAFGADVIKHRDLHTHLDVFWADEGFLHFGCQSITRLHFRHRKRHITQLLDAMPLPDAVLYTRTTPEASMTKLEERMRSAGQSARNIARKTQKRSRRHQFLVQRVKVMDETARQLAKRGVKVVKLAAHAPLDQMAAHAEMRLELNQSHPDSRQPARDAAKGDPAAHMPSSLRPLALRESQHTGRAAPL